MSLNIDPKFSTQLNEFDEKLKPLDDKGSLVGRVVSRLMRQIGAGVEKFLHKFTEGEFLTRQEYVALKIDQKLKAINTQYLANSSLKNDYDKAHLEEFKTYNENLKEQLNKIKKICKEIGNETKIQDKKITPQKIQEINNDVATLELQIDVVDKFIKRKEIITELKEEFLTLRENALKQLKKVPADKYKEKLATLDTFIKNIYDQNEDNTTLVERGKIHIMNLYQSNGVQTPTPDSLEGLDKWLAKVEA